MKKILYAVIVLSFVAGNYVPAWCQVQKNPKAQKSAAPAGLSEQERAAVGEQATALLTGKVWQVYWSLQGASKPVVIQDELTFTPTGVTSKYLTSKGFGGSNYSLRVHDDKVAVWETVQQNFESGDMAMMRGEIRNADLLGTITLRTKDGQMQIFSYGTNIPQAQVVTEKTTAPVQKQVKEAVNQKKAKE
jgi:hypothetical protein